MYTLPGYVGMCLEERRVSAYRAALKRSIVPGRSTVLDLGTGLGCLAIVAAQLGARKVIAVDTDNVIHLAKKVARDNGCAERIEFIQADAGELAIEPVDIIVSDLRGVLPLLKHGIVTLIDARSRLLAPNGCLIPHADTVKACLVEDDTSYRRLVPAVKTSHLDLSAAQGHLVNNWARASITAQMVRTPPATLFGIDYDQVQSPDHAGRARWSLQRDTTFNGLCLWFDAKLDAHSGYSNAPGEETMVYGQGFFPFPQKLSLRAGELVDVEVNASLVGDDYVWSWRTEIGDDSGQLRARFRQSSFRRDVLSPAELARCNEQYAPRLNRRGEIELFFLSRFDGCLGLHELAAQANTHFPDFFRGDSERALEMARELSSRCG